MKCYERNFLLKFLSDYADIVIDGAIQMLNF